MVAWTKPARLGSRPAMASASGGSAVQIGSTDETFSRGLAMTILYGELLPRKSVEFQNAPGDLSVAPFFLKFRGPHPLRWALLPCFPRPLCPTARSMAIS